MVIKGRGSIHTPRDTRGNSITSSPKARKDRNGSQEELSQDYESDNENRSQNTNEEHKPPNTLNKTSEGNTDQSPKTSPKNTLNRFEGPFVLESALPESSSRSNLTTFFVYLTIGAFAIAILSVLYCNHYKVEPKPAEEGKVCSFENLKKNYQQENDFLWEPLKYGIEDILNNKSDKPAVFLFVHNGTNEANQLIEDIASRSASCFDSSPTIQKIDFKSNEAREDHGNIVAEYKRRIKEGNVILIAHLNEIPPAAAKAFHSICDTYSPIVKKVVIILSLIAKRESNDEKIIDTAENAINGLWESGMERYELDPIITRVTDQVLLLQTY